MRVSIIAAVAKNLVIGKDNDLIWQLPKDMKFFKDTTKGHHVIMGRRNYLSIPEKYRPLPGRPNIVVTRNRSFEADGADVVYSVEAGLALAKAAGEEEAFIIGGGMIYDYALKHGLVDRMYLTKIDKAYEGDTYFPVVQEEGWQTIEEERFEIDDAHESGFTIYTMDKL